MKRYLLALLLGVLVLGGCTPGTDSNVGTPGDEPLDIATLDIATIDTATIEVVSTVVLAETATLPAERAPASTQVTHERATATPTQSPTPTTTRQSVSAARQSVCREAPQRFNFREELGIERLAQMRFEDENLLTFEGWTQRPEPVVTPQTPEPTPEMYPEPFPSASQLLVGGQLSLPQGELTSRPLETGPLLANPCGETCPLEVISQSPDEQWQLVQITDWLREKKGIWLVSQTEMAHLIPYVPSWLEWRWARDSSSLWLVYSDPEVGAHTLLAHPGSPIITREVGSSPGDLPYLLSPWPYIVAFSPIDKTALSTPSFEFRNDDTDELFTIDLTETFTQTGPVRIIPGIVTVDWNEATESFLLQVVNSDDSEVHSVEIQNLSEEALVVIPKETLDSWFPSSTGKVTPYYRISEPGGYALSPSGRQLAVVQSWSSDEIWIFECHQEN